MSDFAGTVARQTWGVPAAAPQAGTTPTAPVVAPTTVAQVDTSPLFYAGLQEGMTQKDNENGTYNIFDAQGNDLGVGYKDLMPAYEDITYQNGKKQTTATADGKWTNPLLYTARQAWVGGDGNEVDTSSFNRYPAVMSEDYQDPYAGLLSQTKYDPKFYDTQDALNADLKNVGYAKDFNGTMGNWEALGQAINGATGVGTQEWGRLPSNGAAENVTGANTLYGSTPIFGKDDAGKYGLLGYRTDLTPGQVVQYNGGPDSSVYDQTGTYVNHNGENHVWSNNNWREINDIEAWRKNALIGEEGKTFIPKEAVDKLTGWTNKDSYDHEDIKKGIFQKSWEATSPTHLVFGVDFKDAAPVGEAIGNICGAIWSGGIPWGSLIMAVDGYSKGDEKAGNMALVRAGLSYAMSSGGGGDVPADTGGGITATGGQTGVSGGLSTTGSSIGGGGLGNGLTVGAGGGVSTAGIASATAANAAATAAAKEAGFTSLTSEAIAAIKDVGTKFANLKPADFGIATGYDTVDKLLFKAGMSAIKAAAKSVITQGDMSKVFEDGVKSAITSLVGNGAGAVVGDATGSNVAGMIAGNAAGAGASAVINNLTAPDQSSQPTSSTTATNTSAPGASTYFASTVARRAWS